MARRAREIVFTNDDRELMAGYVQSAEIQDILNGNSRTPDGTYCEVAKKIFQKYFDTSHANYARPAPTSPADDAGHGKGKKKSRPRAQPKTRPTLEQVYSWVKREARADPKNKAIHQLESYLSVAARIAAAESEKPRTTWNAYLSQVTDDPLPGGQPAAAGEFAQRASKGYNALSEEQRAQLLQDDTENEAGGEEAEKGSKDKHVRDL